MNTQKIYNSSDIEFYGLSNLLNACWDTIQANHELGMNIYFGNETSLEVVYNHYQINNDGDITESRSFEDKKNLYFFVRNIVEKNTVAEIQICYAY